MANLFTFHSQPRWDFILKTALAWGLLTAMAWIPVGLIPGTALPFAWAGVVMIGIWMGMRVGMDGRCVPGCKRSSLLLRAGFRAIAVRSIVFFLLFYALSLALIMQHLKE